MFLRYDIVAVAAYGKAHSDLVGFVVFEIYRFHVWISINKTKVVQSLPPLTASLSSYTAALVWVASNKTELIKPVTLKSGNATIQHLSEKMQFCVSAYCQVVQKR